MIRILDHEISPEELSSSYPSDSVEVSIIEKLSTSEGVYNYDTMDQFKFELDLRKNIVIASKALYRSGLSFRVFRKSRCNSEYWNRTDEGGFILKEGVNPSAGIRDIFINGSMYGTECATAIIIVFYGALVNVLPEELFNELFLNIHLMNWRYIDRDLGVRYDSNLTDYLPGDCRYFKNPDVNPLTPEWQGENVIDLDNGLYYGHGIGIGSGDSIIDALNRHRKPNGTESAFLLDSATRPDFKSLYQQYKTFISRMQRVIYRRAWGS